MIWLPVVPEKIPHLVPTFMFMCCLMLDSKDIRFPPPLKWKVLFLDTTYSFYHQQHDVYLQYSYRMCICFILFLVGHNSCYSQLNQSLDHRCFTCVLTQNPKHSIEKPSVCSTSEPASGLWLMRSLECQLSVPHTKPTHIVVIAGDT